MRRPSNFVRPVKSTVRIGTLMPTPSVSVPEITVSRPAEASCSTSRRYFGSMPAWCTPMPCVSRRLRTVPKPAPNRKPLISAVIAARSSRVVRFALTIEPASSTACACAKDTT